VPPGKSEKLALEEMRLQSKTLELQAEREKWVMELLEERRLNNAKIIQLEAQAMNQAAQAQGENVGQRIAVFDATLGALRDHNEAISRRLEVMAKGLTGGTESATSRNGGGMEKPSGNTELPEVPPIASLLPNGGMGGGEADGGDGIQDGLSAGGGAP
jgi:hypothetical protein